MGSIAGVCQEYSRSPTGGPMDYQDSRWTPSGCMGECNLQAAGLGHLCLFLPKFHCELNPIEYSWGMVKKYLCDHCDYSFNGLKDNLPKALDLVPIQTVRRWEHRLFRWLNAYREGL